MKKKNVFVMMVMIGFLCVFETHSGVEDINPVVKVVAFHASDIPKPTEDELDFYAQVMFDTQDYYREEMKKHGFGPKTFSIDLRQIGEVNISVVRGPKTLKEYTRWEILVDDFPNEVRLMKGDHDNIQVIFLLGAFNFEGLGGLAIRTCWEDDCLYNTIIPTGPKDNILPANAHEIGHSFGLDHQNLEGLIMNPVPLIRNGKPQLGLLTKKEAAILDKHRYFINMPIEKDAIIDPLGSLPLLWGSLKSSQ